MKKQLFKINTDNNWLYALTVSGFLSITGIIVIANTINSGNETNMMTVAQTLAATSFSMLAMYKVQLKRNEKKLVKQQVK